MTAQTLQTPRTLPSSPERRRTRAERPPVRPLLIALLVSVTATGVAWLGAMYAAPESFEATLAWGAGAGAVALCVAVGVATWSLGRLRQARAGIAEAEAETARFAHETVPTLVRLLREGQSSATALAETIPDAPQAEPYQTVLRSVAEEVGRGQTEKNAAMAACANAAGRMQALATGMLADLRDMEHRHAHPDVLGDLLHLDHRTAQAGRLADSIAVLTGARSGRRWAKPIVMESILRGAMGRIGGYQRVRLHCTVTVTVAGHAAEGVMHALAELLDNAANFSPPTSEVHVYVEEVPAGVIVTVEDSGLVMGDVALRRAERAVARDQPLDLTSLSGSRLGLAVVGVLARKHGLSVSFRPSARGGTGALLMIPHELINRVPSDDERVASRERRAPAADATEAMEATGAAPTRGLAASAASRVADRANGPDTAGTTDLADTTDTTDTTDATATRREPAAPAASAVPRATDDHAPGSDDAVGTRGSDGPVEYGASGLPKRRRGRTLANAHPDGVPGTRRRAAAQPATPRPPRTPESSAARLRAFRDAVRGPQDSQATPTVTVEAAAEATATAAPATPARGDAPDGPSTPVEPSTPSTVSATSAPHPEDDDA
ncbi:ATP-binding protein [Streptomyces sp. 4N509B]|uniref:ATP-binding protein n=1 Tax=Streptomyces sp. 4N509B TaxID=3457413 RepID=UPI003FD3F64B